MRDTIIIGVACLIAIAVGAWLFLAGDEGSLSAPEGPVVFMTVAEGEYSGSVTERTNYRIKSQDELFELWLMVYGTDSPPMPAVDFTKYEVLAIFDGTHSSGGYDVELAAIEDTALSRHVSIVRVVPDEECMTTTALSSPFLLAAAPKTALALSREETTKVASCGS